MKTKIKYLLRMFLFSCGIILFLICASPIFVPKNNSNVAGMRNTKAHGILSEEKNTIDVLFLGDSEAYSAFSPMLMWNQEGFTSYVSAIPGLPLNEINDLLEQALENQAPKIVVLETNAIFRHFSPLNLIKKGLSNFFPILEYHDRWKTITINDFHEKPNYTWKDDLKGFNFNKKIQSGDSVDYMRNDGKVLSISKTNEVIINKIIELCHKNNIQLIFTSVPSSKNWNYAKHIAIKNLAEKNEIPFIDMNMLLDVIGIDWEKDTRDQGDHINYYGAEKVSGFLGSYLKNNFGLVDHRNDSNFENWNESYKKYEKMIQNK